MNGAFSISHQRCQSRKWLTHFYELQMSFIVSQSKLLQQFSLTMKILQNSPKIAQMESRLAKYTYLSRNNLPGYLDGVVFQNLKTSEKYPDRVANPNLYHWYILMRQFAPATINKWIDDRIYYDADDALIKPELPNLTNAFKKKTSGGSSREEGSDGPKSPKLDSGQIEYVIEVLVKEDTEQVLGQLRTCLRNYKVDIVWSKGSRDVRIKCGSESTRRQEIANLISKAVQYENLQVKRQKKTKTSWREEPAKQ